MPAPVRLTVSGLDAPLCVNTRFPESAAAAVGVYVTVNSSESNQATVPPAALTVKFALSEATVYTRSAVPPLDIVTVDVLEFPIRTFPNSRDEADKDSVGVDGYTIAGPVKSSKYKDSASTETD